MTAGSQRRPKQAPFSRRNAAAYPSAQTVDPSSCCTFFILTALLWLMVATGFALVTSIQLYDPSFLAHSKYLTFGRLYPAYLNAFLYGWAGNAIFAVSLWLLSLLSQRPLPSAYRSAPLLAGIFWNGSLAFGIGSILIGNMTSVELLEIPGTLTPLLLFSYALIAGCAIMTFRYRHEKPVYLSEWYLLAALFIFPWIYAVAQALVVWLPARGILQSIVRVWFSSNLLLLWLIPIALAFVYYLIPKIIKVPIHNYFLSLVAFWIWIIAAGWTGAATLIGGPVPAWLGTTGTIAGVLLIFPVIIICLNFYATLRGNYRTLLTVKAGKFILFGILCFTLFGLSLTAMSLPQIQAVTQYSYVTKAQFHLGTYGFFSMILVGALYFMLPRLLNQQWPSSKLIQLHFLSSALGLMLSVSGLSISGLIQGTPTSALDATAPSAFADSNGTYLLSYAMGWGLIAIGHLCFGLNTLWMIQTKRRYRSFEKHLKNAPIAISR